MTTTVDYEFRSELLRELAAQQKRFGEELGEARGEARSVLTVLETRGVEVPADIRDRILACTDLNQLDIWLRRALTATSVDEVLRD